MLYISSSGLIPSFYFSFHNRMLVSASRPVLNSPRITYRQFLLCPLISIFCFLVHLVKAMVFPVVMYGCESWTVKKAERRRNDAFEPWCWRRLLRVPWTARRSQPVHSEGDQPWDFFGRNDAKAETPVLWPPHVKS